MNQSKTYVDITPKMTATDFECLSKLIYGKCGIKMPPEKKIMLEARLQKRLRLRGITSFRAYCDMIFKSPAGSDEIVYMIDAVTTNKTDFFREPIHFTFLTDTALPEFIDSCHCHPTAQPPFMVWSSACSSGEEPYTLAIVLGEFEQRNPGFTYAVTASDISTRVLDKARTGIYEEGQISMIPLPLKQRYFLRSRDRKRGEVRVVPKLRSRVLFQRLNLMDEKYPLRMESVDALFCRNVIIYFDRQTQLALLGRLCQYIRSGGYLFLGHSETVHGLDLPLVRVMSTIYRKI